MTDATNGGNNPQGSEGGNVNTTTTNQGGSQTVDNGGSAPAPAPAPSNNIEIGTKDKDKGNEKPAYSYDKTGNASLDLALGFIGKYGISPESDSFQEALKGNFNLMEAELAEADAKAWQQHVAILKDAYDNEVNRIQNQNQVTRGVFEEVFGGPDNTDSVLEWARQNAEPAEREALNDMINQGGIPARAAALWLNAAYGKAHGTVKTPKSPVSRTPSNQSTSSGALSPDEFKREVAKLYSTKRGDIRSLPEYKDLLRRRKQYH